MWDFFKEKRGFSSVIFQLMAVFLPSPPEFSPLDWEKSGHEWWILDFYGYRGFDPLDFYGYRGFNPLGFYGKQLWIPSILNPSVRFQGLHPPALFLNLPELFPFFLFGFASSWKQQLGQWLCRSFTPPLSNISVRGIWGKDFWAWKVVKPWEELGCDQWILFFLVCVWHPSHFSGRLWRRATKN